MSAVGLALDPAAREARKLRVLGALAAGVAHELNTPAQYIGDNLRFLADAFARLAPLLPSDGDSPGVTARGDDVSYLLEEVPSAIEQSIEGIAQVVRLVGAVRQFATAAADAPASVDLNALVDGVLTVARHEWKYGAGVTCELDPALPPVPCVAGEVRLVVLVLLLEAVRASRAAGPGNGRVTVRTVVAPGWAELTVSDGGAWSGDDPRALLADDADAARHGALRGARPDLTVVRDIVTAELGGTIRVAGAAGGGTSVVVRLPLAGTGGTP